MTRDLIKKLFVKNWGMKMLSALIALILWVMVLASKSINATKEVHIVYRTKKGLVVGPGSPSEVTFSMKGSRAFIRSLLDRKDRITVNLTEEKVGTAMVRFFSDSIDIPLGVQVTKVEPSIANIRLERERKKRVPLRLVFSGNLPDGVQIKEAIVTPEKVLIRGPGSEIPSIKYIQTNPVEVSELSETIEIPLTLQAPSSRITVETDKSPVALLKIEKDAEPFQIPNVMVKVKDSKAAKTTLEPDKVTLSVLGNPEVIQRLNERDIEVFISILGKSRGVYELSVQSKLPDGIELVRTKPDKIKVRIY